MKNLTLALDDQTYKVARVVAAYQGMSLTALVRNYLQSLSPAPAADPMRDIFAAMDLATGSFSAAKRLSREVAHARNVQTLPTARTTARRSA